MMGQAGPFGLMLRVLSCALACLLSAAPARAQTPPAPRAPHRLFSVETDSPPAPPAMCSEPLPEELVTPLRAPEPEPPKPLERWPVAVRLGVAGGIERIAKDFGSLGLAAEVGARYRAVSVGVELHGDPPIGSVTYPNVGAVSFARVSGALLLCAHYEWLAVCGAADAGRVLFPEHIRYLPASIFSGAAGVRLGLEFPIRAPRFFLSVALDLRAPIPPASYTAAGVGIFETSGLGIGLRVALLAELPL